MGYKGIKIKGLKSREKHMVLFRDLKTLFTLGVSVVLVAGFLCADVARAAIAVSSSTDTRVMALESVRQNYLASQRQKELMEGHESLSATTSELESPALWLRKVDNKAINMVTNRLFRGEQRSLRIDGKDYFIPNEDYVYNFRQNLSLRYAVDPFTGKRVDKSGALAYADYRDRVFYFESEQSYMDFISLLGK